VSFALQAAACNWFRNSSTTPSTPAATDTFSGTVNQNGSATFTFTVTQSGPVTVTLTMQTPSPSVPLGLGIGTLNSSTNACTVTSATSSAVAASTAQIATTEAAGVYCVKVYDVGNLPAAASVTVTVAIAHS
jgi:hypothetical protein